MMKRAVQRVFLAIDQFGNTLLGLIPALQRRGFGDEDETVSSVLGKLVLRGSRSAKLFCRFLALFDEHHCVDAIEQDEGK